MEASVQVSVPALGESITDGAIATILKQKGEQVKEDEVLMQIETDKVTIDVRAPTSGTVEAILVKEDENVVVGHIIAVIDDSGEASSASSSSPAAEAQKQEAPPSTSDKKKMPPTQAAAPAPQKTAASNDTHGRGRTPSIKFPPRRTSTGNIISMLPAAEAAAVAAAAVENTLEISRPVRMTESPHKSQLFIRVPLRSSEPDLPPRKELSEWEIENIMLGGAPEMEI